MESASDARIGGTRLRQLRHDLLNPLNVLAGAAAALNDTELSDMQRRWVRLLTSSADRLKEILAAVEQEPTMRDDPTLDGEARFADLLTIAAARVGKPFDRRRLLSVIEAVGGQRPLRILLVDDSPELAELVRSYLAGTPWQLNAVENGEQAIAQATSEKYDLVLMDIAMPGLDGATAAHAIRAAELARGASPTPIIAMTAFDPGDSFAAGAPGSAVEPSGVLEPESVVIDDPEIAPLVPEFLANRRADVCAFRQALATGAFAAIQFSAHKMKGTGRGYGFATISRLGEALEIAAHQQDAATVQALIDELDEYLRTICEL